MHVCRYLLHGCHRYANTGNAITHMSKHDPSASQHAAQQVIAKNHHHQRGAAAARCHVRLTGAWIHGERMMFAHLHVRPIWNMAANYPQRCCAMIQYSFTESSNYSS